MQPRSRRTGRRIKIGEGGEGVVGGMEDDAALSLWGWRCLIAIAEAIKHTVPKINTIIISDISMDALFMMPLSS